jgi:hypothetical protein
VLFVLNCSEIKQGLIELREPGQRIGTQIHVMELEIHGNSQGKMEKSQTSTKWYCLLVLPYTMLPISNPVAVRRHIAPITFISAPRQKASMIDIVLHCQTGVLKQLRKVPKRDRSSAAAAHWMES